MGYSFHLRPPNISARLQLQQTNRLTQQAQLSPNKIKPSMSAPDLQIFCLCGIFGSAWSRPLAQPEALIEPYFIPGIAGSALSALLPTPLVLPSLGLTVTGADVGTALAAKSLILASFAGGSALARARSDENLPQGLLEQRHRLHQRSHTSHRTASGHLGNRGWQKSHVAYSNNNNNNKQETSRRKYVQHRKGESEKAGDYLAYFGLERSGETAYPIYPAQLTE